MATIWKERWSNAKQNGAITAGSVEMFADDNSDRQHKSKYGSMNSLFLSNNSTEEIEIELDGTLFTRLFPKASLVIAPEDGLYFNLIQVKNKDATEQIEANELTLRWGRSDATEV